MKSSTQIATLVLLLSAPAWSQPEARDAVVAYAVDGDTLVLEDGTVVHYVGVSAPARTSTGGPGDPFGEQCFELNRKLVAGKLVKLEFDSRAKNAAGELLAYVHVGKYFVNATLIQSGYARSLVSSPNTRFAALFERLEAEARGEKKALWSLPQAPVPEFGNTDLSESGQVGASAVTNSDLDQYDIPGEEESMAEAARTAAIRLGLEEEEEPEEAEEEDLP